VSYGLNCHSWLYRDTLSPSDRCTNPSLAISHLFSGRRRHSAINGLAGPLRGVHDSCRRNSCPGLSSKDVEAPSHRDRPATASLLLGSGSAIAICCPSSGSSCCAFPRRGRSVRVFTRYGNTAKMLPLFQFALSNLRLQTKAKTCMRNFTCRFKFTVSSSDET